MISPRSFLSISITLVALAAAAPARAQTLYAVQGLNGLVKEMAGPPGGACGYPDGLVVSHFDYVQAGVCGGLPSPVPFAPGGFLPHGDIAVDRQRDVLFVTDGAVIGEYDVSTQTLVASYLALPLGLNSPLTGLGWDSTNRWLWICNGSEYAALQPNGTCAPALQVFATPAPAGLGLLTDIDCDVKTGELWVCDVDGFVSRFPPGAAAVSNSMAVTGVLSGCGTLLNVPLTGLALDPSRPGPAFAVTDGLTVARLAEYGGGFAGGAPTNLLQPDVCFAAPAGPLLAGLAFAAHGVTYGIGNGTLLRTRGQSTLPSTTFGFEAEGGPAGHLFLLYGFGPSCPAIVFSAHAILGQIAFTGLWGLVGPVNYAGSKTSLPVPLPASPALPYDVSVWVQTVVQGPAGAWVSSNGVAFTFSRP